MSVAFSPAGETALEPADIDPVMAMEFADVDRTWSITIRLSEFPSLVRAVKRTLSGSGAETP
jgi:predicted DNA binding CopG/RHH family protein